MKKEAESKLKHSIQNVVMTVPAYFNEIQRKSTEIAASLAGLKVLKIITEPAAAALAFGIGLNIDKERNVLIFDIGIYAIL